MTERYLRAKELFLAACDLDGTARAALLDQACDGDSLLRREVESLIDHYESAARATGADSERESTRLQRPQATPKRIGPYRILHELGRGGMGVVYLAKREQAALSRRVALKVLKRGTDSDEVLRRFDRERQVLAALNHPNIASLYDAGETDDGVPYFAMEYVEGTPIDRYCDTNRLTVQARLRLFAAVCSAVHHAHQNLVVHRDIKPANVLVTDDGTPKLLDFGIAKITNPELSLISGDPTAPEFRVMTPEYASPEQVRGGVISTASDIYSLGVLLYELVSGHRPYRLRSRVRAEIERAICEDEPERPSTAISRIEALEEAHDADPDSTGSITPQSVSRSRETRPDRLRRRLAGDIDNIVLMAMRKEPHRRYRSADQFAEDIDRHLRGLPIIARRDTLVYRCSKFVQRHRVGVAAAAIIALLLVGGATGIAASRMDAARQRDRAEQRFEIARSLARVFIFDFNDAIEELPGSLTARQLLVETALTYLDELARDHGDDVELMLELASAYHRVGETRGDIRNPSDGTPLDALDCYRTALDMRQRALLLKPGDPEIRAAIAVSHLYIGDALKEAGRLEEARLAYDECLKLREALQADVPDDALIARDLAVAQVQVATLLDAQGFVEDALAMDERSLATRRRLVAADRASAVHRRDLTVGLLRVGSRLRKLGRAEDARPLYEEAVSLRRDMHRDDPGSARRKRDLMWAEYFLADILDELGEPQRALGILEPTLDVADELVADEPDGRNRRDRALMHEMLGRLHVAAGRWDEAAETYGTYHELCRELCAGNPQNALLRVMLANSHRHIATIATHDRDPGKALGHLRTGLQIIEELIALDPTNARRHAERAEFLTDLGTAALDANQPAESRRHLEVAVAAYQALLDKDPARTDLRKAQADTLFTLSRALRRLNAEDDAQVALRRALEGAIDDEQRARFTARGVEPAH